MKNKVRVHITGITINAPTYKNVTFSPSMINFFYGKNGTGKSTLARAFKDGCVALEWKGEPFPDERILVYNEDFILKNIQSYGNIPGVFTISEVNAQKKKEADEKTAEKAEFDVLTASATDAANRITEEHKKAEEAYVDDIWDKTEKIRKKFPSTQTGYMKDKKKFVKHLEEVLPSSATNEECTELYQTVYGKKQQTYTAYSFVPTDKGTISDLMQIAIISRANTDFAMFIRTIGNMDWVTAGHNIYHQRAGGKCPYCQQNMPDNFEDMLAACYDEQYRKDLSELKRFQNTYQNLMMSAKKVIEANLQNTFPTKKANEYKKQTQLLLTVIDKNISLLQRKLDNPAEPIALEDLIPISVALNEMAAEINSEIKAYMDVLADIPGQKQRCLEMVWGMMASECASDIQAWTKKTEDDRDAWREKSEEAKNYKVKSAELERQIALLNSQTVNTTKAMQDINKAIRDAGFRGFKLQEKAGAKYVYELVRDNGGKPEVVNQNLSEGERHFIAFLYFYHMVMGSQSDEGKVEDKIVVIDDPVSSMDSSSLFIVASLVREMIAVCYNNYDLEKETADKHIRQFFCMTHNPYFFREITYNHLADYECASFFEITKDGNNQTSIAECEEDVKLTGGGKINRSPVRNTYDSYWHEYCTTDNPETLMMVIRQILEYYFIQMIGYKSGNLRYDLLDKNEPEFVKKMDDGSEDRTEYVAAAAMIAMLNVGATGFNDGLYYDSSAVSTDHLRLVFEKIFKVMKQEQHYNMMTGR